MLESRWDCSRHACWFRKRNDWIALAQVLSRRSWKTSLTRVLTEAYKDLVGPEVNYSNHLRIGLLN